MATTEIIELADAWAADHPKRAQGGTVSLRGFNYQFESSLRDAVRAWINAPNAAAQVIETVSDLAAGHPNGTWTITQIKRTGSSGTVRAALEELWTVYQVAVHKFPALVPRLAFEIRCARWELRDAQRVVAEWAPETAPPSGMLTGFRGCVRCSTDPHPRRELIEALVTHTAVLDPIAFVDEWVGRLMRGAFDDRDEREFYMIGRMP